MKNIEIKAICTNPNRIEELLLEHKAKFIGQDHQIDTYFNVPNGRLKLREGNIENALIGYQRADQSAAKQSNFSLYHSEDPVKLKQILTDSLGIKIVVDKQRKIFFIEHIKFHIDVVEQLGDFVEIEVTDPEDKFDPTEMDVTCRYYINLLGIKPSDLLSKSYSDMLIEHQNV